MFQKILVAGAFLGVTSIILGIGTPTAFAAEKESADKKTEAKNYSYTAQPGDSYSQMARKAVQTYSKTAKSNLNNAQIIFTETNLTIAAKSPELEIGQKVTISEATVKSWVEKAKKLSAADKSAWEVYVPYVDFNTDSVGKV